MDRFSTSLLWLLLTAVLRLPSLSAAIQVCTALTDCAAPQSSNLTATCWGGTCNQCPAVVDYYFTADLNTTTCAVVCQNPLTPAGVQECSSFYKNGNHYCEKISNIPGYMSAPSSGFLISNGSTVQFSAICVTCPVTGCGAAGPVRAPNPAGVPAKPPPPRSTLAPAPAPETEQGACTMVTDCVLPATANISNNCYGGACFQCPAKPLLTGTGYAYRVNANLTACSFACTKAETPAGVAECNDIFSSTGIVAKAYCKSISRLGGYPDTLSSFTDSRGVLHTFNGICSSCPSGTLPNAAGLGCALGSISSNPPPPPKLVSRSQPPPAGAVTPSPSPPSGLALPTASPPGLLLAGPPPPGSSNSQNGTATNTTGIPAGAAVPRLGKGWVDRLTLVSLLVASFMVAARW